MIDVRPRVLRPYARPIEDRADGVTRVKAESPEPLEAVALRYGVSPVSLLSWISDGRTDRAGKRHWLDGLHRPLVGWMTSVAALDRFRAAFEVTAPDEDRMILEAVAHVHGPFVPNGA